MICDVNKEKRLKWAQENIRLMNFDNVIFTDETTLQLENHRHTCCYEYRKKLSQQLKQQHPSLTSEEQQMFLNIAEVIEPTTRQTPKTNDDISLTHTEVKMVGASMCAGFTRKFGTRPYILNKGVLADFMEWLTTIDGKERSEDQARQITVDVSKYMYFCNANSIDTSCAHDAGHFNKYLSELKDVQAY